MIDSPLLWGSGMVGLFGFLALAVWQDQQNWERFAIAHNCKVVGKATPSAGFGYGVATDGSLNFQTITIPGKTGFLCDDGVTYWR
ncbi:MULTISPECIES: hypothetical protein [unclassified Chelatococcus]|uniref:hypothetical protein n=1 Tax=unclassified Chelatococcus TaxID=2638111 RepID=UPI001BCDC5E2|nr:MULTISPECIES: hypothetical protein [unclassified Chelatococcus]MBS7697837.1 hypothetical protein [Chelatococcus sp. YT9]MBX3559808.1 hypothetical protein [Chelatococcus sp.]